MKRWLLVGLLASVTGCDQGSESGGPATSPSSPASAPLELGPLLPENARPVGVAITPNGKRYVLDQTSGFYEVGTTAHLVLNVTGLTSLELTDVVALDDNRFAFTAENDGFLFDLRTSSFTSYFCYLPSPPSPPDGTGGSASAGGMPATQPTTTLLSISQTLQLAGVQVKQRTESVAYNSVTQQLFAQPRTTRLDTGEVAGAELFVFNETGGEPIRVLPMDPSYVAGGMVALASSRLVVGSKNLVQEVSQDGALVPLLSLAPSIDITGMARSPNGDVWVLDGAGKRLIRLEAQL